MQRNDMEPDDATLIWACRRGDAAAWDALVARYQVLIIAIARRSGLNPEQADDVFQCVFTALVEHLDRIVQPEQISAWLVMTARREAWRIRRRERTTGLPLDDNIEAASLADDAPLPQEQVLLLEEQQRVRAAMVMLDARSRSLLELLYYQPTPLSYAGIATRLGISEGSIGPTRARCLEKLRRLLEKSE